MKSVVICGSRKFEKGIRKFAKDLGSMGITVYEPILNKDRSIDDLPKNLKHFAFLGLTHHHFSLIRKADVVYFYNKDGYIGTCCTLELVFADALGKRIFALSDADFEPVRAVLFNKVIKTPRELLKILK